MNWTTWMLKTLCWLVGYEFQDLWRPGDGYRVPFQGRSGNSYLILRLARYRRFRRRNGDWGSYSRPAEGGDCWAVANANGEILNPGPITYGQAVNYIWEQEAPAESTCWVNAQGSGFAAQEELAGFIKPAPEVLYIDHWTGSWRRMGETGWIEDLTNATPVLSKGHPSAYQIIPMSPYYRQSFWLGRLEDKPWRPDYRADGTRLVRYSWWYQGRRMSDAPLRMLDAMRAAEHHFNTYHVKTKVSPCEPSIS